MDGKKKLNLSDIWGRVKAFARTKDGRVVMIAAVLVIAIVIMLICLASGGKGAAGEPEEKYSREEYEAAVAEYNAAAEAYNAEAEKMNLLSDRLSEIGGIRVPGRSEPAETLEADGGRKDRQNVPQILADAEKLRGQADTLKKDYTICLTDTYYAAVNGYNVAATEYNNAVTKTAVKFIDGLPQEIESMEPAPDPPSLEPDAFCDAVEEIADATDAVNGNLAVVSQITAPSGEFVTGCLQNVTGIRQCMAVSQDSDPNGLLGKHGGYTTCVYFTADPVADDAVRGSNPVEKGTEGGGCVEVYENLSYALARCDYLSQFDGTLLSSGSYTVIGTMVVRTSGRLSAAEQQDLTGRITAALTA